MRGLIARGELTQLINVIFGNTSMKEGVMVADVRLPPK
jgi:ribulose-bisphosphate carboxylase large chain